MERVGWRIHQLVVCLCRLLRVLVFPVLHVHAGDWTQRMCLRSVLLRPLVCHPDAHQGPHDVRHQGKWSAANLYHILRSGASTVLTATDQVNRRWRNILTPYRIEPPEPIVTKFDTTDYIRDRIPKPYLVQIHLLGLLGKQMKYNVFVPFYLYLFIIPCFPDSSKSQTCWRIFALDSPEDVK